MATRRRNTFLQAVELMRALAPWASLSDCAVFLYIAENEGLNLVEVARVSGLSMITASRATRRLCGERPVRAQEDRAGLIEILPNSNDRRSLVFVLTEAGRELCRRVDAAIEQPTLIAAA